MYRAVGLMGVLLLLGTLVRLGGVSWTTGSPFERRHALGIGLYLCALYSIASPVLAVRHFMALSSPASSAEEFLRINARLLDSSIMLRHYSAERLFSQRAGAAYVHPDLAAIPEHH